MFEDKWKKKKNIPLDFVQGSHKLLRDAGKSCEVPLNKIRLCFSKAVVFLKKSCCEDDLTLASFKLIMLTNLFHSRYKDFLMKDANMVRIYLLVMNNIV